MTWRTRSAAGGEIARLSAMVIGKRDNPGWPWTVPQDPEGNERALRAEMKLRRKESYIFPTYERARKDRDQRISPPARGLERSRWRVSSHIPELP